MTTTKLTEVGGEPAVKTAEHAAGVRWDLDRIFPDLESARNALQEALKRAANFEQRYRGKIAELGPSELADALEELGKIQNDFMRVDQYTGLRFSGDSRDVAAKDLMDACFKGREELENRLRFTELEWQALPASQAAELIRDERLAVFGHYLEKLTAYAPHMRSEAEEAMLAAREAPAVSEWQKLFGENIDKIEVEFDAGDGPSPHTLDQLLALVRHPDRDLRFAALNLAYDELGPRTDVQAACYNSIVGDRLQLDKVRGFGKPMQQANLANDLSDEVVDALIGAVEDHYHLGQRWYRLKADLLGLPKLHLFDQYAPLGKPASMSFGQAWDLFTEATTNFSPRANELLEPFLTDRRIDAEPRTGKRGGAFCTPTAWGDPPYMLMNFTDDVNSAATLAHEAGHGLQFILIGASQPPLNGWMGLAMAEVASTFLQTVFSDFLLEREDDADQRNFLIASQIESFCAVVFRQTMMTGYERRAYEAKASGMSLTADRLSDMWFEENKRYYADSVELPEKYHIGWAYIPHFIDTRFYTYAYSFAHLVSIALYAKFRQEGESFVEPYFALLGAGGSKSPQALLASAGIDIRDPNWPNAGFSELQRMIDMMEPARAN